MNVTNDSVELYRRSEPTTRIRNNQHRGLGIAAMVAFGLAILLIAVLIQVNNSGSLLTNAYLLPWIILLFIVVCSPMVYLIMHGTFGLYNPLVYAAWSYFLPTFVLGSLYLASGLHNPWWMEFIRDPEYYLPLTLVYLALGFISLTLGYTVPLGRRIGAALAHKLPAWDWEVSALFRPAIILVVIGEIAKLGAFSQGNLGYVIADTATTFGAMLHSVGLLSTIGTFLLWLYIFRSKRLILRHYLITLFLIALIIYAMLLSGSKGGLIIGAGQIFGAYVFSGKRIKLRQTLLTGFLVVVTLYVGFAFGIAFRQNKGNEAQVSLNDYFDLGSATVTQLASQGLTENLARVTTAFLERVEVVSSLAVYVANYKEKQPLEASYGIADIWTMTWTAFIPRFIWPNKPIISGARGLGLLYFNLGTSSPAVTPMIDLLRHYGPIGVLLGMALLGIILRIFYVALIQRQPFNAIRSVGYYLLLTAVSYEGQYGSILPTLIRVCVVLLVGIAILFVFMPRRWRVNQIGAV
ncbi:MAG: hypothetical protein ACYC0V_05660 [Armatimonadota bacterium]